MAIPVGSSGTLVATSLETLGYYYQSYVLENFAGIISGPMATMVFIAAALGSLAVFVLTGKAPQMVGWMVIGPTICFAVLYNRTETQGSEWMFGAQKKNQGQVALEVREYLKINGEMPPALVSSLFANYNRIISSLIRSIIDVMTIGKNRIDGKFIIRQELAAAMRSENISDSTLVALIKGPLLTDCQKMIAYAKDIPSGQASVDPESVKKFNEAVVEASNPSGLSAEWIAGFIATQRAAYDQALIQAPEQYSQYFVDNPSLATVTPGQALTAEQLNNAKSEVKPAYACWHIWNFTYYGLYRYAAGLNSWYRDMSTTTTGNDTDLLKELSLIKRTEGVVDDSYALVDRAKALYHFNRIVANYLLRNAIQTQSAANYINEYSTRGMEFGLATAPGESDVSALERSRLKLIEWQAKGPILATATSLPYYQGMALYILALLFPFFAITLLIPNGLGTFMLWFYLWAWIKSWDIGFTVVMLLDDLLYTLFQPELLTPAQIEKMGLQGNIREAVWSLQTLDPTFQLSTYYNMIGACLGAVPVISSYLVLRSLRGGAGLIAAGAQQLSSVVGSAGMIGSTQYTSDNAALMNYQQQMSDSEAHTSMGADGKPRSLPKELASPHSQFSLPHIEGAYSGKSRQQRSADVVATAAERGRAQGAQPGGHPVDEMVSQNVSSGFMGLDNFKQVANTMLAGTSAREAQRETILKRRQDLEQSSLEAERAIAAAHSIYTGGSTRVAMEGMRDIAIGGGLVQPSNQTDGAERAVLSWNIDRRRKQDLLRLAPQEAIAKTMPVSNFFSTEGQVQLLENQALREREQARREKQSQKKQDRLVDESLRGGINGKFLPPIRSQDNDHPVITGSYHEARKDSRGNTIRHRGVDYPAAAGSKIHPMADGYLLFREAQRDEEGKLEGWGFFSGVYHGKNAEGKHLFTTYAHHFDPVDFTVNHPHKVSRDDSIASVGSTGNATGPNVHAELVVGEEVGGRMVFKNADLEEYRITGNLIVEDREVPSRLASTLETNFKKLKTSLSGVDIIEPEDIPPTALPAEH